MTQFVPWNVIEAIERGAYRVLLYGPPGTGKTRSAYNAARALEKRLFNVTLSDETPAAELRGHFVPEGSEWRWMHGPAVLAFLEGGVLLLDEIDKASQDCLDFLHGLLNDPEVAQLTLPNGQTIFPHKGFQVIATMNGDITDLQPSLQDRFSIAIEVSEPHPDAILSLPEDLRGVAANVESYEIQQRPQTIRRWGAYGMLRELEGVGEEFAAKAVFAHRAQELLDAVRFRDMKTEEKDPSDMTVSDPAEEDEPCTCSDCAEQRARAWMLANFGLSEVNVDDDDDPLCPSCEVYKALSDFDTEEEAAKAALMCCYDDAKWISFCRSTGRSFV